MLLEYIGSRRDPNYPTEVRRTYKDVRYKRVKGSDRDNLDDQKIETEIPVITPIPKGKTITRKGITLNFIPESNFICDVVDHEIAGELLSYRPPLFRKVDSIPTIMPPGIELGEKPEIKKSEKVKLDVKKPQSFVCDQCDFKTTSQIGLISHTKRKHPKPTEGVVNA